jgi:hypothetical protein
MQNVEDRSIGKSCVFTCSHFSGRRVRLDIPKAINWMNAIDRIAQVNLKSLIRAIGVIVEQDTAPDVCKKIAEEDGHRDSSKRAAHSHDSNS